VDGRPVHSTGFAEYSLESAEKCYPLPNNISVEEATLLDAFAVAVHAVHRVTPTPADNVVVLGVGAIGLAIVQMSKAISAAQVIAVGKRDEPLVLASQFGCDRVVNINRDDLHKSVLDYTNRRGADIVYEAVGGDASTLASALEIAAPGGRIGITGSFSNPQPIDVMMAMRKELSLDWVWSYGTWHGVPEYQIALEMLMRGQLQASPLITHRFPLGRIGEAFAAADDKRSSGALKVLVIPG
jgi:threonine dehydrogenase-like Zn-dependent dehydrogenase